MRKKTYTKRQFANVSLKEILNFYPISETKAFEIARVSESTWRRWKAGTANPPPATVELIRLMALGEPPAAGWDGFSFINGLFYDDHGHAYTKGDIRTLQLYKIHSIRYFAMLRQQDAQKQDAKKPPIVDGSKPLLKLVK